MPAYSARGNTQDTSNQRNKEGSSSTEVHPQENPSSSSPVPDDEEDRFIKWYNALPLTESGGRVLPKDWAKHWQPLHQPRWYDYVPPSRSPSLSSSPPEAGRSSTATDSRQGAKPPGQESKKRGAEEREPEASRHDSKRRDTKADRPSQRTYSHVAAEVPVIELPRVSGDVKAQTHNEISPLDAIMGFASGADSNILGKELLETLAGEYADRKSMTRTSIVRDFMRESQEIMYKDNVYQSDNECAKAYTEMLKKVGEALEKYNIFEKSSITGRRFETQFGNDKANDDIIVLPSIVALARANRALTVYGRSESEHTFPSAPLTSMQFVNDKGYPGHYYNKDGTLKPTQLARILDTNLNTITNSLAEREKSRAAFFDKISEFESRTCNLEKDFAPANKEVGRHNTSRATIIFKSSIKQAFEDVHAAEKESVGKYRDYVKSSARLDPRPRERGRA